MDALIAAAGRAPSQGDVLGALQRVALRDDPPALALRGIAMAQLGEWADARQLLRRATRGFGMHEVLARARCLVAEAEVALALRELGGAPQRLADAAAALQARGDLANAVHARQIALRRLRMADAHDALQQARTAAAQSGVPALQAEVDAAAALPAQMAARLWQPGGAAALPLTLAEVAARLASGALMVDAGRHGLHAGGRWWPLARRPILFTLLQVLAEGWPGDVDRSTLIARAFRTRDPDDSHRARLRVEIGRLRALAAPVLAIVATPRGFALKAVGDQGDGPQLLLPPVAGAHGALQALLADGAAWSTSALALALGESQRNVQRALAALQADGRVRAISRGRTQRWLAPPLTGGNAAFTTILLLPSALPDA